MWSRLIEKPGGAGVWEFFGRAEWWARALAGDATSKGFRQYRPFRVDTAAQPGRGPSAQRSTALPSMLAA